MDAEFGQHVFCLQKNVEEVADRRTLIAAHVADARLQQRFGHREDAFAVERGAGTELEIGNFLAERNFHGR